MANIKDIEVLPMHIEANYYTPDEAWNTMLKHLNMKIAKLEASKNDVYKAMRRFKNLQKREVV